MVRSKEDVKERVEGESEEGRVRQRQKDREGVRGRKEKRKSEQQIIAIDCYDNVDIVPICATFNYLKNTPA